MAIEGLGRLVYCVGSCAASSLALQFVRVLCMCCFHCFEGFCATWRKSTGRKARGTMIDCSNNEVAAAAAAAAAVDNEGSLIGRLQYSDDKFVLPVLTIRPCVRGAYRKECCCLFANA